jgi:putative NADH-flavin reductase
MAGLVVQAGDAGELEDITRLVQGAEAVVSALGPSAGEPMICSRATGHVLSAMAQGGPSRYVLVSGMAQDMPGDAKSLENRVASWLIRKAGGLVIADKARELGLLMESEASWTALRPPMLNNKPATGQVRFSSERCLGRTLSRGDLAASLLACVVTQAHLRQAPFVAN